MKILFVCHSHPALQAGGTEIYSHALFSELQARGFRGLFLAGTAAHQRPRSPGTALQATGVSGSDQLLWTAGFDTFFMSQTDLHGVIPELIEVLEDLKPDIIHIHHVLQVGLEFIQLARRILPQARIIMTLHDFYPICANDGQMTTPDGQLCHSASPDACRGCFKDRTATDFRVRALLVEGAFAAVDVFVAPSAFLRERYIAGGMDPKRIVVVKNGISAAKVVPHRLSHNGRRDRFVFFGHLNQFKGAAVAMAASERLSSQNVMHSLALHGSSAYQSVAIKERLAAALALAPDARVVGAYSQADQSRLIAAADWVVVPSIWWENAPLVVQEAFLHKRPVICSDIGGMAEMVTDGVDGLHAPVGDPVGFAATMRRAIEESGLWKHLVNGISPVRTIAEAADDHVRLYQELLEPRAPKRHQRKPVLTGIPA